MNMFLAPCYGHRGTKKTLIVHTDTDEICGHTYTTCWRCHWLEPVRYALHRWALRFKKVDHTEPF